MPASRDPITEGRRLRQVRAVPAILPHLHAGSDTGSPRGRVALSRHGIQGALERDAQDAAARLLTANIGCRLHFGVGLHERGAQIEVEHPTLLARQLTT